MNSLNFKSFKELVAHLELTPHVEGGYYRETYRGDEVLDTPRGPRNDETTIYYCLPSNDFSVWHKLIDLTETFHFHYGDPAIIYKIIDGKIVSETLAFEPTGHSQIVIEPNIWFAIKPSGIQQPADYSLMSCRVVPGFDFADLAIADESILSEITDETQHKLAISLLKSTHMNRNK
jgi:uncharacterized protein